MIRDIAILATLLLIANAQLMLGSWEGYSVLEKEVVESGFRGTRASNKGFKISSGFAEGFKFDADYYGGQCGTCVHIAPCSDPIHKTCLRVQSCNDKDRRRRCKRFRGCRAKDAKPLNQEITLFAACSDHDTPINAVDDPHTFWSEFRHLVTGKCDLKLCKYQLDSKHDIMTDADATGKHQFEFKLTTESQESKRELKDCFAHSGETSTCRIRSTFDKLEKTFKPTTTTPEPCVPKRSIVEERCEHAAYDRNYGTAVFASDWEEHDLAHGGASSGNVKIDEHANQCIVTFGHYAGGSSLKRLVDTRDSANIHVDIRWKLTGPLQATDEFVIEACNEDGSGCHELTSFVSLQDDFDEDSFEVPAAFGTKKMLLVLRVKVGFAFAKFVIDRIRVRYDTVCDGVGPTTMIPSTTPCIPQHLFVKEQCKQAAYDRNYGTAVFASDWEEHDLAHGGASSGHVKIDEHANNCIVTFGHATGGSSLKRLVDTRGSTNIRVDIRWKLTGPLQATDEFVIEACNDDGSGCHELASFTKLQDHFRKDTYPVPAAYGTKKMLLVLRVKVGFAFAKFVVDWVKVRYDTVCPAH